MLARFVRNLLGQASPDHPVIASMTSPHTAADKTTKQNEGD